MCARLFLPMPDSRIGTLDYPQRFGARSISVYDNSKGPYYKLDGLRESVHGNQHWTKFDGSKMRGTSIIRSTVLHRHVDWSQPHPPMVQQANGDSTCVVCLENVPDHILKPCHHLVACVICAGRLKDRPCPICRVNVGQISRVFTC